MKAMRTLLTVAALGGVWLLTGCNRPSRAERALAEKDTTIRGLQEERLQAQEREAALLEQQQKLAETQKLTAAQNAELAQQNRFMAEKNAQVVSETNARVSSIQSQMADLEKKLGTPRDSQVTVVASGNQKEPGAITIRVVNSVLFDSGKADLKSSGHGTLAKVAETLHKDFPQNFIRVEGHTDSTPVVHNREKFADNMALSQSRAKAVFDYLVNQGKLPANRMYTAGYACSQPVAWPENSASDRAKNRRVDIVILPNVKVEKQSLAASK